MEYLQFAFRWMNNLLMRELPLRCTIRLWDTYQVRRGDPPVLPSPLCHPPSSRVCCEPTSSATREGSGWVPPLREGGLEGEVHGGAWRPA